MRVRLARLAAIVCLFLLPATPPSAEPADGSGISPCGIPYMPSTTTPIAHALLFPSSGRTIILYNPGFLASAERRGLGAAMFRYLMQHECGHHVLGHITAMAAGPRLLGAMSRHLELKADCYAAMQLRETGDVRALQAGVMLWNSRGTMATGPFHPIGFERSAMLLTCYGSAENPMPGF